MNRDEPQPTTSGGISDRHDVSISPSKSRDQPALVTQPIRIIKGKHYGGELCRMYGAHANDNAAHLMRLHNDHAARLRAE